MPRNDWKWCSLANRFLHESRETGLRLPERTQEMVSNFPIGVSVDPTVTAFPFVIMRSVLKLNIRTAGLPRVVKHIITNIAVISVPKLLVNNLHVMLG